MQPARRGRNGSKSATSKFYQTEVAHWAPGPAAFLNARVDEAEAELLKDGGKPPFGVTFEGAPGDPNCVTVKVYEIER